MKACLSGHPDCSGVCPCGACVDFIVAGRVQGQMVWPAGGVVARAMHLAGPPFDSDLYLAGTFMRAYAQAVQDGGRFAVGVLRANQAAQQAYAPPRTLPQPPPQARPSPVIRQRVPTEEENLLVFQEQMLIGLSHMSPADKLRMAEGVSKETLEGWDMLSPDEREIMRAIFIPPAEVLPPEDEPLPSNESAVKVVAAMRNGTLGPDTLAPAPAPRAAAQAPAPAQQTSPAASAAAGAAPEQAPQPARGSTVTAGSEQGSEKPADGASIASAAHQETTP